MPAIGSFESSSPNAAGSGQEPSRHSEPGGAPFFGLIDAVLVPGPLEHQFDGSVDAAHAKAIWTWLQRDVGAGTAPGGDAGQVEQYLQDLFVRLREVLAGIASNDEQRRRLKVQLGGEEVFARLNVTLHALKSRALLPKAQAFGRATNAMTDEAALVAALHSMPLQDRATTALLMHAAMGQVQVPGRLISAAIKLAGGASEAALARAGMVPLVDAVLAHAQAQVAAMRLVGPFADIDRSCRAIDRYHRLVRSLGAYLELPRGSRWSTILGAMTTRASQALEARLKDVVPDLNLAMRRGRDGADRVDPDQMLKGLGGIYLLAALRDAKDSLALNALFEQAWTQSAQALEMHLNRNLDLLRSDPDDQGAAQRLDTGIKMAEIRFNPDYAETLRRARAAAIKR